MKKIFIVALSLALVGCDMPELPELNISNPLEDKGIEVDLKSGKISWTSDDDTGSDAVDAGDENSPYGWPSEIIVYPSADVLDAETVIKNGNTVMVFSMKSEDTPLSIRTFYYGVVSANKYSDVATSDEAGVYKLSGKKDDLNLDLTAEPSDDDKTLITIKVSK